jgi:hypothetical protein
MKIHFNIRDETDETEETLHVHYLIILLTFPDWNESIGISNIDWECPFTNSISVPKKCETHLQHFHLELYQQYVQDKEKVNNGFEERRTWEICRKQGDGRKCKIPIWNYFYVYKDHLEFHAVICKPCYDKNKDTAVSSKSWEHSHGSQGPQNQNLVVHLQREHPEIYEKYKSKPKLVIDNTTVKS